MNIDEEVKNLKKRGRDNPPPPNELLTVLAAAFSNVATVQSFDLFRNKKFRKLAKFNTLNQTEQDRIFNELVVSAHVLIMLTLEAPDLRLDEQLKDAYREFLIKAKDEIPNAYMNQLRELGIPNKFLKVWKKLFEIRYDEYEKDKNEVRMAGIELESKKGDVDVKKLKDIQIMLPINVVAMGAHRHILRGKTKGRDELFKMLIKWLGKIYVGVRIPLEGGKINLFSKLAVKSKLLKNKLKGE